MTQVNIYLLLGPFSLLAVILCLVFALVNRKNLRNSSIILFLLVIIAVILLNILELLAKTDRMVLFYSHCTYSVLPFLPITWLLSCIEFTSGTEIRRHRGILASLLVIPVITVIIAWTNEYHGFLWVSHYIDHNGTHLLNKVTHYGFWFWVYMSYAYALYIAGTAHVFRRYFKSKHELQRISVVGVAAASLPLACNLLYVFRLFPGIHRDYSLLVFSITALAFVANITRSRLSDAPDRTDVGAYAEGLSRRELAVCALLAEGRANKEIADALCISENTTKTHIRHIYRKLNVKNRSEFQGYIAQKGLPGKGRDEVANGLSDDKP